MATNDMPLSGAHRNGGAHRQTLFARQHLAPDQPAGLTQALMPIAKKILISPGPNRAIIRITVTK